MVIVGDGGIGKTCLLEAIKKPNEPFNEEYVATVAQNTVETWPNGTDGDTVKIDVWDTAGQEAFGQLRTMSYPESDVIILTFDLTNATSLANLHSEKGWRA